MSGVTFHYNRSTGQIWSSGFIYSVVRFWSNLPTSVFISTFFWDWHNFVRIFSALASLRLPSLFLHRSWQMGVPISWLMRTLERASKSAGRSKQRRPTPLPSPRLTVIQSFSISCVCEMNMWSVSAVRKEDFIVAILQSVINQFYRIVVLKLWSGAFWAIPRHLCRSNVIYRTSNN